MGEYGFEKMKKSELVSLAYDFWRSIEKSKAEIERIRAERIEAVRAEIREEERKEWVQTGLQMAYEELDNEIDFMVDRDEISDDIAFRMRTKIRQCLDDIDVASIV
jgi:hypothetical protein